MAATTICTIDGCDNPILIQKRGLCSAHYQRWQRHGDPEHPVRPVATRGAPMAWAMAHIDYEGDECLIWPFARAGGRYGALWQEGAQVSAHAWMYQSRHGPKPTPEHEAAHSCGNGHLGCIHPGHLRWATPKENGEDKVAHGRSLRGSVNHMTKFDDETVVWIFSLKGKISARRLSASLMVDKATILRIWHGETWGWLTGG